MSITAEEVSRLRRMVSEPATTTYTDETLRGYIERYPILDRLGNDPFVKSETTPVTAVENEDWTETYDLNAAAADIWAEKGAALATNFDFSAGGQSFQRSQAYQACMRQSTYYRARRAASSIRLQLTPKPEVDEDAVI